jgi:Histidine kinase-, DNA gyrase B-, and HSP90-like ATPase
MHRPRARARIRAAPGADDRRPARPRPQPGRTGAPRAPRPRGPHLPGHARPRVTARRPRHVEIPTGTRDRHTFVSIANTGPTVPPEQVQRLFQPFQRLGGVRTGHNSGHGLGLSIVQAIANAHRTELTARARPEGGLTIEVSFPAAIGAGSGVTSATGPDEMRQPPRLMPPREAEQLVGVVARSTRCARGLGPCFARDPLFRQSRVPA